MATKVQLKRYDGSGWVDVNPVPADHNHPASDITDGDFSNIDEISLRDFTIQELTNVDDDNDGILILCPAGGNSRKKDTQGTIIAQRSSGAYGTEKVDFSYSSAKSKDSYNAYLNYIVSEYSGATWSLVEFDYDGDTWVGLRRKGGTTYWVTGVYFYGQQTYTGNHSFAWVATSSVSNLSDLSVSAETHFTDNVYMKGDKLATEKYVDDHVEADTNNYVDGASGDGDSTLTLTRKGLDDVTVDLSHGHSEYATTNELDDHKQDDSNPHSVTASQVGARDDSWVPSWGDIDNKPDLDHVYQRPSTTGKYRSMLLTSNSVNSVGDDFSSETDESWYCNKIKVQPETGDIRTEGEFYSNGDRVYHEGHKPTASEVGARSDSWMPSASDVGARPDDWMPSASDVGAAEDDHSHSEYLEKSGGTITGDLQFDSALKRGDGERVFQYNSSNNTLDIFDN